MKLRKASSTTGGLRLDGLGVFGLVVLVILVFLGAVGPFLPLGDPTEIGAGPRL